VSGLNQEQEELQAGLNEDLVQEALLVAERVRQDRGGVLDDEAIQAISEATGAPLPYIRAALLRHKPEHKTGILHQARGVFLALEPDVRRHVGASFLAANVALLSVLTTRFGDSSGFFGIAQILLVALALWNVSLCRDSKTAALNGAIFGGLTFALGSLFALLGGVTKYQAESWLLIPFVIAGTFAGMLLHGLINRNKGKLGFEDPVKERQELLRQLMDLQQKLKAGEQSVTFLSIDIAGSTRMKELADPLSVEFTFTEYHRFVEMLTKRHGGRIHSTAGDGVICCFDTAQQAFSAAKNIQTGIIELNTFRNRIGVPITLRAGVHAGSVVAPGADIKSVNFAHVIDIASHLQKVCPEGGVVVSQPAALLIPGGPSAIGSTRVQAQNVDAVVWQPRVVAQSLAGAPPPPPPTPAG
jgi:class 3 adenylate cyclase